MHQTRNKEMIPTQPPSSSSSPLSYLRSTSSFSTGFSELKLIFLGLCEKRVGLIWGLGAMAFEQWLGCGGSVDREIRRGGKRQSPTPWFG